jgi:hypothetical protein
MNAQSWSRKQRIHCLISGLLGWVLLLLCVSSGQEAQAQAWTQPQGGAYVKTSFALTFASEQFNADGNLKPYAEGVKENAFYDQSLYIYMEAGALSWLTFSLSLPYKMTFIQDRTYKYETRAWSNILFGVRLGLKELLKIPNSSLAFALNVFASIPSGYTRNYTPSVGLGLPDIRAFLNLGYSLYPLPIYIQGGVGFRYRFPNYFASRAIVDCKESDINCFADSPTPPDTTEFRYNVEIGFSIKKWVLIQLLTDGIISIRAPKVSFSISNPLPADQRTLKAAGSVVLFPLNMFPMFRKLGVSAQVGVALYGQNTIRSLEFMFGLEYGINFAKLRR